MPKLPKNDDADALRRRRLIMKGVAERLALWRTSVGEKKLRVARRLGISHQRWHHYESGRNELDLLVALDLCAQEGLTLDFIYRNDHTGLSPDVRRKLDTALSKKARRER